VHIGRYAIEDSKDMHITNATNRSGCHKANLPAVYEPQSWPITTYTTEVQHIEKGTSGPTNSFGYIEEIKERGNVIANIFCRVR